MNTNEPLPGSRFLQTCDIPLQPFEVEPFTLVIFGGAGDLSKRKLLPTLFHLYQEKELPEDFSVLALARSKMTDEQYRQLMKEAIREFSEEPFNESSWDDFSSHLSYLSGLFEEDQSYEELNTRLDQLSVPTSKGNKQVIYYLSVPPHVTPLIVEKLKNHRLCKELFDTKIIIEKPFGRDRTSAVQLNKVLTDAFDEKQIYRIDHYLGKETVQNIIFFRFSNTLFEDLWNSRHIDHVQITVAEDLGIEHRSTFYEESGVIRDIVQNHLLQLIAMVAMEPPIGFEAEFIRDEKRKVFLSIHPMSDDLIDRFTVRGQYGPGKITGQACPWLPGRGRDPCRTRIYPPFSQHDFTLPIGDGQEFPFISGRANGCPNASLKSPFSLNSLRCGSSVERATSWSPISSCSPFSPTRESRYGSG